MLRNRIVIIAAVLITTWCGTAWAGPAESAAASKKQGDELLAQANFDGALKAYAAAAKTDSSNAEYRTEYAILRRVISMREAIGVEKNPEKWEALARGLRNYYHSHKVFNEALTLDKKAHEKLNNADSATMLADTYLAMDKAAEAEQVLDSVKPADLTPDLIILKGIAQARQNKMDDAKATAGKLKMPADANPNLLYNYACLQARIGDKAGAASTLTRCFEQIPPSRLDATKAHARQDRDLSPVVDTPEFASALKTESKVKESKCSGGGDCGSCSKKGGCSTDADKTCTDEKHAPAEKK